jgi:hypothetical protein
LIENGGKEQIQELIQPNEDPIHFKNFCNRHKNKLLVVGDFVYHVKFWGKFGVTPAPIEKEKPVIQENKKENIVDLVVPSQVSFENVLMKKIEKKKDTELKIERLAQKNTGSDLNLVKGSIETDFCLLFVN